MRTEINGFRLAYEESGKGAPLLFIHGFPLNRNIWRPQIEALRSSFRVITPDVRGHGESEATSGVYEMESLAEDVAGLLQHLQCGPAYIAGHSMGGYILFALWRKNPELVRGMILVSTRAAADTAEGQANREALAQRVEREGHEPVVAKMLTPMLAEASVRAHPNLKHTVEAMMRGTSVQALSGASRGMAARSDSTELLPRITVPTLIIAGTADALIHPSESEKMARAIPQARFRLIEGAGHLPSLEKPEEVNVTLREWLSEQSSKTGEMQ